MTIRAYAERYAAKKTLRMHMPGHKGKRDPFDLTEIAPRDLGALTDVSEQARRRVAAAYGAETAHLLTGGSTLGLLAALWALPAGRVLFPKFSHRSVYAGCVLSGREPAILETEYDEGLPLPPSAQAVARELESCPELIGAVITSPDYYGRCAHLDAIRRVLGEGRYLIVDAAHGAHFGLRPELPPLFAGNPDATVVSAHKTLPALTQTAIAFPSPRFALAYRSALGLLATTSPSYPLLASIEEGVAAAAATDVTLLLEAAREIPYRVQTDDPLRIVLDARRAHSNGAALAEYLSSRGVEAEFADDRYVVLIGSCMDTPDEYAAIARLLKDAPAAPLLPSAAPPRSERAEPFLRQCEIEYAPLSESAGRILAEEVGWYPPCTPLGVRGDRVSAALVTALEAARETFGVVDGRIAVRREPK